MELAGCYDGLDRDSVPGTCVVKTSEVRLLRGLTSIMGSSIDGLVFSH